jgi:ketosteroid isomerase-like protein
MDPRRRRRVKPCGSLRNELDEGSKSTVRASTREYKEHVRMLITGVSRRWKGMAPAVAARAQAVCRAVGDILESRSAIRAMHAGVFMFPIRRSVWISCIASALALGGTAFAEQIHGSANTPSGVRGAGADEKEIRRIEAALCHAFEAGDAAYLRHALDPGFTLTGSTGVVTDFAQNISEVEKREPAYDVFRNHDQVVRLYGDAAIVTGVTTVEGRAGGEAFAADFQFTDTWVRRDGRWLLAASHASRLPAKAGAGK